MKYYFRPVALIPIMLLFNMASDHAPAMHLLLLGSTLLLWGGSIACLFFYHRHHKRAPQLTPAEKEVESAEELVFKSVSTKTQYIKDTILSPATLHYRTVQHAWLSIFLAAAVALGEYLPLCVSLLVTNTLLIACIEYKDIKNFREIFTDLADNNFVTIVNNSGLLYAVQQPAENEGKQASYYYTNSFLWNSFDEIVFSGLKMTVIDKNESIITLRVDTKQQLAQLKMIVARHFPAKQNEQPTGVMTISNYNDTLKPLVKNFILLGLDPSNDANAHLSGSYIGYCPALPANFKWPTNHGLPLTFLGQVNCADLAELDDEQLLPQQGRLLFFYELKEMLMNEKGNNGCVRVVYNNSPVKNLEFREDLLNEDDPRYLLNFVKLQPCAQKTLPYFADACQMSDCVNRSTADTYYYAASKMTEYEPKESVGTVLGYPCRHELGSLDLDGDKLYALLLQLSIDENNFYHYLASRDKTDEYSKKTLEFFNNWTELNSMLYFFVPKEDLKNLDFSNLRFVRRSLMADNMDFDLANI